MHHPCNGRHYIGSVDSICLTTTDAAQCEAKIPLSVCNCLPSMKANDRPHIAMRLKGQRWIPNAASGSRYENRRYVPLFVEMCIDTHDNQALKADQYGELQASTPVYPIKGT